jgi:hypothetical protein
LFLPTIQFDDFLLVLFLLFLVALNPRLIVQFLQSLFFSLVFRQITET